MKKIIRIAALLAIVAFTATSCLDGDEDNSYKPRVLTPQEKTRSLMAAQGFYSGYLYYHNNSSREDSLEINWVVTANDSTVTIEDFPLSVFANSVHTDSTTLNKLKKAPTVEMSFTLHGYYQDSFGDGYYTFSMTPNTLDFTFGEDNISITYASYFQDYIYGQTVYYYPICEYLESEMQGRILIGELDLNGTKIYANNNYIFYGKKN